MWAVSVEANVINNDGNLIDAVFLGIMISLLHFRRPFVQVDLDLKVFTEQEREYVPLSINHVPICFTFGIICIDDKAYVAIDPIVKLSNIIIHKAEEECVFNGRVTIATNIYGDICYIHKPGGEPIE